MRRFARLRSRFWNDQGRQEGALERTAFQLPPGQQARDRERGTSALRGGEEEDSEGSMRHNLVPSALLQIEKRDASRLQPRPLVPFRIDLEAANSHDKPCSSSAPDGPFSFLPSPRSRDARPRPLSLLRCHQRSSRLALRRRGKVASVARSERRLWKRTMPWIGGLWL
jgi:hypothetical protein